MSAAAVDKRKVDRCWIVLINLGTLPPPPQTKTLAGMPKF
jgi:hypothetical protein